MKQSLHWFEKHDISRPFEAGMQRVAHAQHHNPFEVLGIHQAGKGQVMTVFRPGAEQVWLEQGENRTVMQPWMTPGCFALTESSADWPAHPQLVERRGGHSVRFIDPYTFPVSTSDAWLRQFNSGECFDAESVMGAHRRCLEGVEGVLFVVWAPNASRVSVVGDFNQWDGRVHAMRCLGDSGVWELFIPGLADAVLYKYELRQRDTGAVFIKADPYGRRFQRPPETASEAPPAEHYAWQDSEWLEKRAELDWLHAPMSVYEMHLGSWKRHADGRYFSYRELADDLIPYVANMGFTHIELLPVTEYPFDGSWGYQVTGYFAPTSRFGTIADFKYFVDQCHQHRLAVIVDWVPAHFPKDAHALARFDGTPLYEDGNPRRGEHKDWGTLIFNYGRNEVRNFLFSSACFWLREFHIDGLRVDAVASMLYLDYSRDAGEWEPNRFGGNENLEAVAFVRRLNEKVHELFPGALMIAEESTAWPQVSRPVYLGGLGFSMKWNMGWMNDSLSYFSMDPVYRQHHHEKLTFTQMYAYSENFMLPLSHDEVVHEKRALLEKMPGDQWRQFANLRLLFTYQFTHPGKKLLFMGDEFGQRREWSHDHGLDWHLLQDAFHKGVQTLVRDLNGLYCSSPALHQFDFESRGFNWIDCHDHSQSVISFVRQCEQESVVVVLNFTPVVRHDYRIGVPPARVYGEIFNSDSHYYGGSDVSNGTRIEVEPVATMGYQHSLNLVLPPLAGIVLAARS